MPNAQITKKVIVDSMKGLMAEKPFAKITVGDIVGACGINRNSFYYHFQDKFDLVNWIFTTEITKEISRGDMSREEILTGDGWILIERICVFLYNDRAFYENALSATGQNSFSEHFAALIKELTLARSASLFLEDEDQDFFVSFFADAFVATLAKWLSSGAQIPPEKFVALIRKAATGAAVKILEVESISPGQSDGAPLPTHGKK